MHAAQTDHGRDAPGEGRRGRVVSGFRERAAGAGRAVPCAGPGCVVSRWGCVTSGAGGFSQCPVITEWCRPLVGGSRNSLASGVLCDAKPSLRTTQRAPEGIDEVQYPLAGVAGTVTASLPGGARRPPAGRRRRVRRVPAPETAAPRILPACHASRRHGAAGIRPPVLRTASHGGPRRGRPRAHRILSGGPAGMIPPSIPGHLADHVPGRPDDVRRGSGEPGFRFPRDSGRPNTTSSRTLPCAACPRPFATPMPRGFTEAVGDARKAAANPPERAARDFSGGSLSWPPSPVPRPPGRFPAHAGSEGFAFPGPFSPAPSRAVRADVLARGARAGEPDRTVWRPSPR